MTENEDSQADQETIDNINKYRSAKKTKPEKRVILTDPTAEETQKANTETITNIEKYLERKRIEKTAKPK